MDEKIRDYKKILVAHSRDLISSTTCTYGITTDDIFQITPVFYSQEINCRGNVLHKAQFIASRE